MIARPKNSTTHTLVIDSLWIYWYEHLYDCQALDSIKNLGHRGKENLQICKKFGYMGDVI